MNEKNDLIKTMERAADAALFLVEQVGRAYGVYPIEQMDAPIDVNKELGYNVDECAAELAFAQPGAPILTVNAYDPVWRDDCKRLAELKEIRREMSAKLINQRRQIGTRERKHLKAVERMIDDERKRLGLV